ncbi:MAG: ChaN family lipoprotein [Pseudomonadota bacterium]
MALIIPPSSRIVGGIAVLLMLTACATDPLPDWQAPRLQEHPLAGTVHDVQRDRSLSPARLRARLQNADFALLGEKHDNPDHHARRLALLEPMLDEEDVVLLSMEMLTGRQQARIDALDPELAVEDARLNEALDWESGWHWPFYRPVLQAVLSRPGVRLKAGNIDTDEVMSIYRGEPAEATSGALDGALLQQLHDDIRDSHCGQLPDDQIPAMVRIQQARDHAMAESLRNGGASEGVRVLLAGNYHVRNDVGVAAYLPDGADVVTVAFLEVEEGKQTPEAYLSPGEVPPWDYVWFTPATEEEDYCAGFQ